MNTKEKQSITFSQMALALTLIVGSFSLFSITFGLQKNKEAFYTNDQDKVASQETRTQNKNFSFGSFISFVDEVSEEEEEAIESKYILQKLERLGNIKAQSFLVGDLNTGEIIFERKPHTEYAIASVTKYMTAYTAAETFEPNEIAKITPEKLRVEGNRARFVLNDRLTIRELLYPLLLVSSNDAGEVISQQHSRTGFIESMKKNAKELGMHHTNFEDPTGLSRNNYSTARDLFVMMRAVRNEYPQIIDISRLSFKENDQYLWENINKAASFPEFRGGKTGYTNAALQTSIGYYQIKLANDQVKNIAVVILQSNTREQDTRNILEYLKRYVAYL